MTACGDKMSIRVCGSGSALLHASAHWSRTMDLGSNAGSF